MGDRYEFERWIDAERDAAVAWLKAQGYRIVKLRESDNYMDDDRVFTVEEEL